MFSYGGGEKKSENKPSELCRRFGRENHFVGALLGSNDHHLLSLLKFSSKYILADSFLLVGLSESSYYNGPQSRWERLEREVMLQQHCGRSLSISVARAHG
jgi:hypothetical protein